MKCDTDPNCLGITFPYRDDDSRQDAWFSDKKGVAVCKNKILLNKPEKDWNVYQKCSGSGSGKKKSKSTSFSCDSKKMTRHCPI